MISLKEQKTNVSKEIQPSGTESIAGKFLLKLTLFILESFISSKLFFLEVE
jgi:hypothetical protein